MSVESYQFIKFNFPLHRLWGTWNRNRGFLLVKMKTVEFVNFHVQNKAFTLKWLKCDFFVIDVVVVNIMYRSLFSGSPFYRHLALPLGYGMNEVTFQWKSIKGELKGRKYEKLKTKAFLTVYRYSISWKSFWVIDCDFARLTQNINVRKPFFILWLHDLFCFSTTI